MKKLCFVVQRYGEEINGGAEAYTRTYAERLAADYDITVLTSCALDYVNWKNRCPRGAPCALRAGGSPPGRPGVGPVAATYPPRR